MFTHLKINFHLNNSGRDWFYALEGDPFLKPLKAATFKEALKEVQRLIEAL